MWHYCFVCPLVVQGVAASAKVNVEAGAHAPPTLDTGAAASFDAHVAAATAAASTGTGNKQPKGTRHSTATMPVTRREHKVIESRPPPPVWDPRSPTAARTPKQEIKKIRASVVIQEEVRRRCRPLGGCAGGRAMGCCLPLHSIPSIAPRAGSGFATTCSRHDE